MRPHANCRVLVLGRMPLNFPEGTVIPCLLISVLGLLDAGFRGLQTGPETHMRLLPVRRTGAQDRRLYSEPKTQFP